MAHLSIPVGSDDHAEGPDDALVTVVEYGDYECPYCKAAHPVVKALQRRLSGRMRFVFRNFPLAQIHPHAQLAAEAAEAAGAQGFFWQMHDTLFEHQRDLSKDALLRYAILIEADPARFASDLEAHTYAGRVRADFMSGVRSGVNGTPTFFINGVRHDGPATQSALLQAIEAMANTG